MHFISAIYLLMLTFACLAGCINRKRLDGPQRLIWGWMSLVLGTELLALQFAVAGKENHMLFSYYTIVEWLVFVR